MNPPSTFGPCPGDIPSVPRPGEIPPVAGGAILLVDDDPAVAAGMAKLLRRHGYEVLLAANGAEAMRLLACQAVGLMITDIFMDQMDGLQTITELWRKHPEIPIIAISGGSPRFSIDCLSLALALGASAVIHKPIGIEVMLEAVKQHGHGLTRTAMEVTE